MALPAEVHRRLLLAESDNLLDEVETLRLHDAFEAPTPLREAIRALQIRLGRRNPPVAPATVDAAHELVFAVQQRLMALNPRSPRPTRHHGRPGGQPAMTIVREDRRWKVLTLPPPTVDGEDEEWIALVEATVERAWDRWCYAQQQAVRAARLHVRAYLAFAVAGAAWSNYFALLEEADTIKRRLAAGRPAARRP